MRRLLATILILTLSLTTSAVRDKTGLRTIRMSDGTLLQFKRHDEMRRALSQPTTVWNANKTYRLPVILISFSDCDFSQDDARTFYDRMFNEPGFNLRQGPGCVADYFRDQSNGLFNLAFDVVGPVKVDYKSQAASDAYRNGRTEIDSAVKTADEQINFANYDWEGNGRVPAVIIIYAGFGGNETAEVCKGRIWPNMESLNYRSHDGPAIAYYACSQELWSNSAPCGIGSICHEFSHVLGLPDFYPTAGDEYSVLDEWDLMDGGNYSDDGWCPPNYSIHEREYLGWQQSETLTSPQTVTQMSPLGNGGTAYRIVNDACPSEYYLLENRQREGWDRFLPGHGLLVSHVDFRQSSWTGNTVNVSPSHHRMDYFHADGHDVEYFIRLFGDKRARYDEDGYNLRLRNTAYPYAGDDGILHDALTDATTPAATIYNARRDGSLLMGKPVTDIQEDGELISFNFCQPASGIASPASDVYPVAIYDLLGRRCPRAPAPSHPRTSSIYIIKYSDGTTIKKLRD